MEVWRDSATQYGESEKFIISFLPGFGDRILQYSDDKLCNPIMEGCVLKSKAFLFHSRTAATHFQQFCLEISPAVEVCIYMYNGLISYKQ